MGLAGGAALLLVRWLHAPTASPEPLSRTGLAPSARVVLAAIIPVMLDGALPSTDEQAAARAQTLTAAQDAIAGLPPAARAELTDLFSLLDFAPTRCLIAGVWTTWPEASNESVAGFLARWRDSRFELMRSAYSALHQIVLAAWYAQPRAWPATGYAGPPSLSVA